MSNGRLTYTIVLFTTSLVLLLGLDAVDDLLWGNRWGGVPNEFFALLAGVLATVIAVGKTGKK